MGNAEGNQLAPQAIRTVVPVRVGGVGGEALVPRPVERMHMEDGCVLPGPLDVAVELPQRFVEFTVVAGVCLPHRGMEVDRR